jgi:hypothetical protein
MIKKFYSAQKAQSLLFIVLGILAIILSVYTLLGPIKTINWGFGIPFGIMGLFQIWLGINTLSKTKHELEFALNASKNNSTEIKDIEMVKISNLKKNYLFKNYFFLGLNGIAIILLLGFGTYSTLKGLGLALFVQSLIHISSLYFEKNRTETYLKWLNDYYN